MFLAFLLAPLLVGRLGFYLVNLIGLTIGLVMGGAVLIAGKITVSLAKLFS